MHTSRGHDVQQVVALDQQLIDVFLLLVDADDGTRHCRNALRTNHTSIFILI